MSWQPNGLPLGWQWLTPDELASAERHTLGIGPFGSDLKVSDYTSIGVPLIFVRNIRSGQFLLPEQPHVSTQKAESLAAHRVTPGDVLITKMGEPPGDSAVYPEGMADGRMTADCIRLRVNPRVAAPKFIFYATLSNEVRRQVVAATRGVAQNKISLSRYRTVLYPIPSLSEQRRIVSALDSLLSRADYASVSLTRAKANVKRARASVLKAAVEGRLVPTEAAPDNSESLESAPADSLLNLLLANRRVAWSSRTSATAYREPIAPRTVELPRLPHGWTWVSIDQVASESLTNGRSVPTREGGFPVLRLTAMGNGRIDFAESKGGEWSAREASGWIVQADDFFLMRGNGSLNRVGSAAIAGDPPLSVAFPDTMIRLRTLRRFVEPRYLLAAWASPLLRSQIEKSARTTAGIFKINQSAIAAYAIPLPPRAEQLRIVAEVDRRLSVLDALDASINANLARCASLRQAILKRAFDGRLVPAQSDDHIPASRESSINDGQSSNPARKPTQSRIAG